jgi:hypothetical protein
MGDIGSFMAGKHLVQFMARNKHGATQAATAVAAAMTPVSGMGGGAAPARTTEARFGIVGPTSAEVREIRQAKAKVQMDTTLEEIKEWIKEWKIAGKEGGQFKRRENWKGRAGFVKRLAAIYKGWPREYYNDDQLKGGLLFNLLSPKEEDIVYGSRDGSSYEMYKKHGINID